MAGTGLSVVIVLGYIRFAPQAMAGARPHLQALIDGTRAHDGCIAYDAAEDVSDPGLVRFSEVWPDAASLAAHGQAPHIAPWRAASADLGVIDRQFTVYDAANPRPL